MNHPSETGRTVGGGLPGEGERVVLQPALPHHLHVPHEVQQIPPRQVTDKPESLSINLITRTYQPTTHYLLFPSHICSFWIGSTNFDETKMTFDLDRLTYDIGKQNPVLDYIIEVVKLPER